MIIPTLEEKIRARAEARLNQDIKEVQQNFSNFLSGQKGLFRTGISLCIMDGERKLYPWLSELFKSTPILEKIIEHNLPDYVQREIDAILKNS